MNTRQKIIGHEKIRADLDLRIEKSQFAQTTLIYGVDGIGKRKIAEHCAASILCVGKKKSENISLFGELENEKTEKPCHVCVSCKMLENNQHPDYFFISPDVPDEDKKSKQRTLRIEQIKELREKLRFLPLHSSHQVVVMDDIDTMSRSTANALLKILEEPRTQHVFILVTSRPGRVLPTIHSRATRIHVPVLTLQAFAEILSQSGEGGQLGEIEVKTYYNCFGGSVGRALRALENKINPVEYSCDLPSGGRFSEISNFVRELKSHEENLGLILQILRWKLLQQIKRENRVSPLQLQFFERLNEAQLQQERHVPLEFVLENLFL